MDNNLMIFLVSICLITLLLMYRMVKKKKILFKHALMWCLLDLILLICIFTLPYLRIISDFIGLLIWLSCLTCYMYWFNN